MGEHDRGNVLDRLGVDPRRIFGLIEVQCKSRRGVEADDVCQDVMVIILNTDRTDPGFFTDDDHIYKFANCCTKRLLLNLHFRQKSGPTHLESPDAIPDPRADNDPANLANVFYRLPTSCEEQAALLVAFEPIVREVFERRCRKMKVEDVAGELKISRSTTNRYYRNARDALRRLLEGRIREGDLHP